MGESHIENHSGHNYCKNWGFESEDERDLANALAKIAESNGVGVNEFRHAFTFVLRTVKHKCAWSS